MTMYYYFVFNQIIESSIIIPFLNEINGFSKPDVIISREEHLPCYLFVSFLGMKYGGEIRAYTTNLGTTLCYSNSISLSISNDSRRISIVCKDEDLTEALLYCFTSGIIIQMYYKQRVIFHGSVFTYCGYAHALLGDSGVGKTTLLMHLASNEIEAFADDIVSVDNSCVAVPNGDLQFKLCNDMVTRILPMVHRVSPIIDGLDKSWIALSPKCLCTQPKELKTVFVLKPHSKVSNNIEIRKLSGVDFVEEIVPNLHAYWCLPSEIKKRVIKQISCFQFSISFVTISYKRDLQLLDNVANKLLEFVNTSYKAEQLDRTSLNGFNIEN